MSSMCFARRAVVLRNARHAFSPPTRSAPRYTLAATPRCTRSYTTPIPTFASTVGRKPGFTQFMLFRKDGSPRSKKTGIIVAGTTVLLISLLTALEDFLEIQEGQAVIAWSLVQCYRTDLHYEHVDFSSYRAATEYFRDLVFVLLVNVHEIEQETILKLFEVIADWENDAELAERVKGSHHVFRKAAKDIHRLLIKCDEVGMGLVETGLEAVKLLNHALLEFGQAVGTDEAGTVVIDLKKNKMDKFKDWDIIA